MEEITATAGVPAETQQPATAEQAPVVKPAIAPANVFGFAPDSGEPVGAAEELDEESPLADETSPANATPNAENASNAGDAESSPQLDGKPQKRVGEAWFKERERRDREIAQARQEYEQKLSSDPIRQLGQLMIDNIITREGKTPEEAAKIAEERFIAAYAKQEGLTPAQARLDLTSKRLLAQQQPQQPQRLQQPQAETPEALAVERATEIVDELMQMQHPEGFDLDTAMHDSAFTDLLTDYEPRAAVRIYLAETRAKKAPQQIADRLRARQQIPQTMRPQQAIAPEPSYRDMTSAEFFAEKERLMRKQRE